MTIDRRKHDLMNALLFLETFPEILRQQLRAQGVAESEELAEMLELYRAKIEVVKAGLPAGPLK